MSARPDEVNIATVKAATNGFSRSSTYFLYEDGDQIGWVSSSGTQVELNSTALPIVLDGGNVGGYWSECALPLAASLMKAGPIVMKLTIPASSLTSGIIYDHLRLELDEAAAPAGT